MTSAPDLLSRHRLSVTDYFRMGETGILARDARVELINGEIIDMTPIGSRHAGAVNRLNRLLIRAAGDLAVVSVQNPIILGDSSAPEPDLCLLKSRDDDYTESHPRADDVLLAIEVADSSLAYDRDVKIALYAGYGIAEVWLVDLVNQQIFRFRQISSGTYQDESVLSEPGVVSPVSLPKISVDLTTLF